MLSQKSKLETEIRALLDTVFRIRVALAEYSAQCTAAILRQIPEEYHDGIITIKQEFADLEASDRRTEEQILKEIRQAVKSLGAAVKGTHLQATYGKGRDHWDTEGLFRLAKRCKEILEYYHEGEPIIAVRTVAQRVKSAPLFYDEHK